MALACSAEAATTLEGLRSCSIIHTYLACTTLAVAWTPYDVSATPPYERVRARSKDQPWPWVGG